MDADAARELKALGDPRRIAALEVFAEGVATPHAAGKRAATPISSIAYHVRILIAAGFVELASRTVVGGSVTNEYRITEKGRRGLALARQWERDRQV
jgi:hypothetical protein